jgi:hypothetical protein
LSSQITKAVGNEVLIIGPRCGQWSFTNATDPVQQRGFLRKLLNDSYVTASYARSCYGSPSTSSFCNTFVQQQIHWSVNAQAPCPFASELCQTSDSAALELDTGYIDSHTVLGLNGPKENRVLYRRVTTCAPINSTGRMIQQSVVGTIEYSYYFGFSDGSASTLDYSKELKYFGLGYYL